MSINRFLSLLSYPSKRSWAPPQLEPRVLILSNLKNFMNISKKTILVSTAAFIFVLALWLGLSFYSVGRVASAINQMVSQPDPKSSFRFKNLQHQTGFLSAKGDVWVSLADKFSEDGLSDTQPVWLQVQYDVSHLILPTSLARFEWRLQPLPERLCS